MSGDDKFELEKRNEVPANYHSANMSSDCRLGSANFVNSRMGSIPTGNNSMPICKEDLVVGSSAHSTGQMMDSYCLSQWDNSTNSQNLGFSDINGGNGTSTSNVMGIGRVGSGVLRNGIDRRFDNSWNQQSSMLKGGLFLSNVPSMIPHSLSQFPADSGFIERAARYSCFSNGNFSDIVSPFGAALQRPQDILTANVMGSLSGGHSQKNEKDASLSVECGFTEGSPLENERSSLARSHDEAKQGFHISGNVSDEADLSAGGLAEPSMFTKGLGSKKRKRISQGTELDQIKGDPLHTYEAALDNTELQQKGDQNHSLTISKNTGKQCKNGPRPTTDPAKEEYIHVRARRGQATNSHSLAERVRREKISERMKFLQDLVPGCSKVTGKAVMLDEIINYVQSLQRQVEFLSMKLATVNPRLDFNIESLLTKDIIQSRAGPSSSIGHSPVVNMTFPQLLQSHPGLIQAGLRNSSDTFLRTLSSEFTNMTRRNNEPNTTQLPNAWEDELHNVVQMGLGPNTPTGSQDLNGSMSQDNLKVEL